MTPPASSPTVVLVHGAWADGSSWSPVIAELNRARIPVIAAPIPLTSLDDDGETVADVFYRNPPHPEAPQLAPDDQGWIWLPVNAFGTAFAQHATAEQQALLAAVQRPVAVKCIQQPLPTVDGLKRRGPAREIRAGPYTGTIYWCFSCSFSAALAPPRADSASASFLAASRWASALSC